MCLDLIKLATKYNKTLQEKKRKKNTHLGVFFLIQVECRWLSQVAASFLGNMGTKFSPHQPSITDVRMEVA